MNIRDIFEFDKFQGVMTLGDLHGVLPALKQALKYAYENNLFVLSLGDLFDGGEYPYEVADMVCDKMCKNEMAFVRGNHDNKLYRYSIGNPVKLSTEQHETLKSVGNHRMEDFLELVQKIYNHENAANYFAYDNNRFAHGCVHPALWGMTTQELSKSLANICMYGELDGTRDEDGYPNRTYGWVDSIPPGYSAVIGHDFKGLNKEHKQPLIAVNTNGGRLFMTDTGCGKEVGGPATGTVFIETECGPMFSKFMSFK